MAKVILFGSRARGDDHQLSDWDFIKSEQQIENRLLYGFYPDVMFHAEKR